jgi:hypothetical protein
MLGREKVNLSQRGLLKQSYLQKLFPLKHEIQFSNYKLSM